MTKLRLTPQQVPRLPPSSTDYRDDLVPGLVLRVWPSGLRSFAVEYSRSGRSRRFTIGQAPPVTLAAARDRAREIMSHVLAGRDPQAEKAAQLQRVVTVKELANRCLEALELRPATALEYRRLVDVELLPALGARAAADVTRAEVRAHFRELARRAPYVANRAFGVLRRVYSWAASEDLVGASPFVGLAAPAPESSSDRVLTTAELRALLLALDELPGQYSDAVLLLLLTGARREMVVGLRGVELELDGKEPRWTVPAARMKGNRPHVVPLSAWSVEVLRRRLEVAPDVVFPPAFQRKTRPRQRPRAAMTWSSKYVARLRAGVARHLGEEPPRWTIHNLRTAVGTHLAEDLKIPDAVVARILAHAPPGSPVSRIYMRADLLPERRAALVAWAAWLQALKVGGRRGRVLPLTTR